MSQFRVVEEFISINGEGRCAGQLAYFVRFAGCNLQCEYCDTRWANEPDVSYTVYTAEELVKKIEASGVKNVTLTGGEPLLQKDMSKLLELLRQRPQIRIEIETNGSIDIMPYMTTTQDDNITFTLDYKTSASGMEDRMCRTNYENMRSCDTVKFVVGSREDLMQAKHVIEQYHLIQKQCGIYLSSCFGEMEPAEIVDFMIEHNMNGVNVQLQMHKYIWDPDKRGV